MGRIAIVTDAGRNAMDANGAADDGAKADGEAVYLSRESQPVQSA